MEIIDPAPLLFGGAGEPGEGLLTAKGGGSEQARDAEALGRQGRPRRPVLREGAPVPIVATTWREVEATAASDHRAADRIDAHAVIANRPLAMSSSERDRAPTRAGC